MNPAAALGALGRDTAYALRTCARNPGFTAAVTISIALGIAANTTVFSMVNAVLLGELPVREPERLVAFSETLSHPDYLDYRDRTGVFAGVAAHFPVLPASLSGAGEPERAWGQLVSANYFSVVGVRPVLGRDFLPEEDQAPDRNPVVILSHGLWRRRFGADPGIPGRTILMNNRPYTVVGVAPPGFRGTDRGLVAEFWVPLAMLGQIMPDLAREDPMAHRNNSWLMLDARLAPGISRAQAAAAVRVVQRRIEAEYHKGERPGRPITLGKAGGLIEGGDRFAVGLFTVLMTVVALVLLVACANVANLMLARGAARAREIGIRMAVGAGRGRLVRQLLTESVVLALSGAAGGLLLAWIATRAMTSLRLPLPFPFEFDFSPDGRVLAFTAALSVATGLIFGLVPALRATRTDLTTAVKGEAALSAGRRFGLRDLLVVVQVALSLILLAGAGLFLRSLRNAASIDTGMRADGVLLMAFDPKLHSYTPERSRRLLADLRARVEALPGVHSMSYVDIVPLSIGGSSSNYQTEDKDVNAEVFRVGARFFTTAGIPLLRGRDFRPGSDGNHAAIINENLAGRLFGRDDPLGRTVRQRGKKYQIVGVAANAKSRTLGEKPAACIYHFLEDAPDEALSFFGISAAVKTRGNPRALLGAVRGELRALDRHMAVFNVETLREHFDKALLIPQLCASLLAIFGAVGLTLATVGLYGVMSYAVRRRTREIGIRMALGAPASRIQRAIACRGLALAAAGVAAGLAVAFPAGRFTAALLYGVGGTDPLTFAGVAALLLAVAAVAALVPARRAARVDPTASLRYE